MESFSTEALCIFFLSLGVLLTRFVISVAFCCCICFVVLLYINSMFFLIFCSVPLLQYYLHLLLHSTVEFFQIFFPTAYKVAMNICRQIEFLGHRPCMPLVLLDNANGSQWPMNQFICPTAMQLNSDAATSSSTLDILCLFILTTLLNVWRCCLVVLVLYFSDSGNWILFLMFIGYLDINFLWNEYQVFGPFFLFFFFSYWSIGDIYLLDISHSVDIYFTNRFVSFL